MLLDKLSKYDMLMVIIHLLTLLSICIFTINHIKKYSKLGTMPKEKKFIGTILTALFSFSILQINFLSLRIIIFIVSGIILISLCTVYLIFLVFYVKRKDIKTIFILLLLNFSLLFITYKNFLGYINLLIYKNL